MTTYIAYDSRSGTIISVHHGAVDANYARERAHHRSKIAHTDLQVLTVESSSVLRGKRYKVDPARRALVETPDGEGVGFGFGEIAKLQSR